MLSFRALSAWSEMIAFIQRMPRELHETVMVQEQLGFALNQFSEAERLLTLSTAGAPRRGAI